MKYICFYFLLLSLSLFSQDQSAKTENGKKVILKSNGSWKYINEDKTLSMDFSKCNDFISTTMDKVTGESNTGSKSMIKVSEDGKKMFRIIMVGLKRGSIGVEIKLIGDAGCIDDAAIINILFRDGSRLKIISNSDFNCKGSALVYFGGTFGNNEILKELIQKDIETMRVGTRNSSQTENFSKENSLQFRKTLQCLSQN